MTVIAREDASGGGADLLRDLEAPVGNALLKLLKAHAHAVHGLGALAALVGRPFLGVDNEDAHARLLGRDLLDVAPNDERCHGEAAFVITAITSR